MAMMDEAMPGCDGCEPDQQAPMVSCHACAYLPPSSPVLSGSAGSILVLISPGAFRHGRTMSPDPHPPRTGPQA
jgi:hypothetical protein